MKDFKKLSQQYMPYMTNMRRAIHQRPGVSFFESETSAFIKKQLDDMGIDYVSDEIYNIVGVIEGKNPGKRILLRADIDALPIQEETGLPFSSEIDGAMHACGHDLHTANLLGVAKMLCDIKDELCGSVVLVFQAAEERLSGAYDSLTLLKPLEPIDGCFAIHVMPDFPTGTVALKKGVLMSGNTPFEIEITGKGGHGSSPWQSLDPIKPACEIVLRLASLAATRFSAFDPVVINPCMVSGGTTINIIPDKAYIKGNTRFFRPELVDKVMSEITTVVENICASYGVSYDIQFIKHPAPPVINDDDAVDFAEKICDIEGLKFKYEETAWAGSDDYAEFLKCYGGLYTFMGDLKEGDSLVPIHTSKYSPDESTLEYMFQFMSSYTYHFLND